MARKEVAGVRGVLGGLISPASPEPADVPKAPAAQRQSRVSVHDRSHRTETPKPRARLGRPPGRRAGKAAPKEKVTVRLDAQLVACYRDWSWDERCQLGELFERALRAYRQGKIERRRS